MPHLREKDGAIHCSIQTGPRHMDLGLVLDTTPSDSVLMTEMPRSGGCHHGDWDLDRLREAVSSGLERLREGHTHELHPVEIRYRPDDSIAYDMVARCTFLIGLCRAGDLEFGSVPPQKP